MMEVKEFVENIIYKQKNSNYSNYLNTIRGDFFQNIENSDYRNKLLNNGPMTLLQSITIGKKFFHWKLQKFTEQDKLLKTFYCKSQELSLRFRESGNEFYRKRNWSLALRCYNLALLFGRPKGEELGLAYANRSALFFELGVGHLHLSIQDIDYMLHFTSYPAHLKNKMNERREKCNKLLKSSKVPSLLQDDDKILYQLKIQRTNTKIKVAEAAVEIKYDEEKNGRKLIVNEEVNIGAVLLIEKPYAVTLKDELIIQTEFCSYCYSRLVSGYPCLECPMSIYCCLDCLRQSSCGFHNYEHRILPFMSINVGSCISERDLLILRLILKAGPLKLWKLWKDHGEELSHLLNNNSSELSPVLSNTEKEIKGVDPKSGIYESDYYQILNLIRHRTENLESHIENIFHSLFLCNLLGGFSNFFDELLKFSNTEEEEMEEFKDFICTLIIIHFESVPFNAISFSELCHEENNVGSISSKSFGTGIFSTISLINHSCAPNAIHLRQNQNCETTVIALKRLLPGDEITITYGPIFTSHSRDQRREELKRKYHFYCMCVACEENWTQSPFKELQWITCPKCMDNINIFNNCFMCIQIREKVQKLESIHDVLCDEANYSTSAISIKKGLVDELKVMIDFFNLNFSYPFQYTQISEELFKKALLFQYRLTSDRLKLFS